MTFKKGRIPWNKGLTKETDSRIKGCVPWNKGLKLEDDPRLKSSWNKGLPKEKQPYYGRKHSEESKQKMSNVHKQAFTIGKRVTWNKGLTKDIDERLQISDETRKKMSEAQKNRVISKETREKMRVSIRHGYQMGRTAWQKGLTKDDPRVLKQSLSLKKSWEGRQPSEKMISVLREHNKNRVFTEELRKKISNGLKKYYETHDGFNKGKHLSEETKQKLREARLKQKLPNRNTSIELLVKNELKNRGFSFQEHISVCGVCLPDLVFPEHRVAVFCDGDYWHSREFDGGKRWKHDREIDETLSENDWCVLRFLGSEIKKNVIGCVDQVISELSKG